MISEEEAGEALNVLQSGFLGKNTSASDQLKRSFRFSQLVSLGLS